LARVKSFVYWISALPEASSALTDRVERDLLVREFKSYLLRSGKSSNSVNASLSAIDNLYSFLGLGPASAKRQPLPQLAPRALTPEELRRLLKAIAHAQSARDRALAMLMLHAGLRISEVHALNISDIMISARKRQVIVRCAKGDKRRVIPINQDLGAALQQHLSAEGRTDLESPLFESKKGNRLSLPAIDRIIRAFGREAGIELSAHCLRHTCFTRLVRSGIDLVTVAEIAGHSRLETTRRYALPTEDVIADALETLNQAS
jgi:integrase/recombinase XerC